MSWYAKIQISIIVFVVCLSAVAAFSFCRRETDEKELFSEAKAEIIKVEPKISRESDGQSVWDKIQSYSVAYRAELNGQKLEKTEDMPRDAFGNFKVGDVAKICYNPQNPIRIKLFQNTHICGK